MKQTKLDKAIVELTKERDALDLAITKLTKQRDAEADAARWKKEKAARAADKPAPLLAE